MLLSRLLRGLFVCQHYGAAVHNFDVLFLQFCLRILVNLHSDQKDDEIYKQKLLCSTVLDDDDSLWILNYYFSITDGLF